MEPPISPLQRLEHIAIQVSDLEESVRWYRDFVGLVEVHRTAERVYLAVGSKPTWDLALKEGGTGLEYFAATVHDEETLATLASRLRSGGVDVEDLEVLDPQITAGIAFQLPGGQQMRAVIPEERLIYTLAAEKHFGAVHAPKEIHHVNLAASDIPALERFLVDHLDMAISDHVHWNLGGPLGLGFWRFDTNHHDVAAVASGGDGLHHFAFIVSGVGDLVAMADRLAALGDRKLENGIGRHGAGNNLFMYVRDPTGNIVEFSTDLARVNDRGAPFRVWERAELSGNVWGPIEPPAPFLRQVS